MLKLFRFLKPYQRLIITGVVLNFIQCLADLYLPRLTADIVDTGIARGDTAYIFKMGAAMLGVALGGVLTSVAARYCAARVALGLGKRLRSLLFARVQDFSLHEFDQLGTASLITRTTNDSNQVQQVTVMLLSIMVSAPMMLFGGILMAVSQDAKLAMVLISVVPVLAIAVYAIVRQALPLYSAMQKKIDGLNLILEEGLTGVRVIRSFDRNEYEKRRFEAANLDLTSTSISVSQTIGLMMPVMMLVLNFSMIAIIWFGAVRIDQGHLQVGALMAFLQYSMQILFALLMVSMMFVMIPRASASAARINEVLDTLPDISDPTPAQSVHPDITVELDNVTFFYAGAEQPALSEITISCKPGETTAIIGGTGSGKSTLINLIARFYDVQKGHVRLNSVDVRAMSQSQLRSHIGLVPQRSLLFTGTIADNLRYGNQDATIEELWNALEIAQARDFVEALEGGLDFNIAQGGTNVSGGQKQRLSIARALLRQPSILLLDDCLSALDYRTDANLRAALKAPTARTTLILVSQRVSTVVDADQIVVLENGRIAARGTHPNLLNECPVYREMVESQQALGEANE